MKKNLAKLFTAILLLSLFIPGLGNIAKVDAQDVTVIRLGHQAPAGTAYDILAHTFKEYIEEETDGRFEIEIYSGGSLGGDTEMMEAMQYGNLDMAVITASDLGMFVSDMEIQDLPYLFEDWEQVYKFIESDLAREFYALSEEGAGFITWSFMPRGFRHTTNDDAPIVTPEDMHDMKIRVAESQIYVDTFQAFGASAQAMAWGEVYTALQQGTIDGHENTIVTINDYKIQEVQKYLSETGHMFGFATVSASPMFADTLSEEDRALFEELALKAALDAGKEMEAIEDEVKQELIDFGMEFNEVDKEAFIALMDSVYDKYFETHDKEWYDRIIEVINAE